MSETSRELVAGDIWEIRDYHIDLSGHGPEDTYVLPEGWKLLHVERRGTSLACILGRDLAGGPAT